MPDDTATRWEHFDHGADIGIRGFGATPARAFEQAALALTAVVTDPDDVEPREALTIRCSAPDLEDLLFDFLAELVFAMSTRQLLFARVEVQIEGGELLARALGEPLDRARHVPAVEVKGPTYTELHVSHDEASSTWIAQCVVDV